MRGGAALTSLAAILAALAPAPAQAAGESPLHFLLAQHRAPHFSPSNDVAKRDIPLIVRASWYGGGERLNARTATGERFNPAGRTAAHRSLPFGARLEIVNLANGRSTLVRVNDRGPASWTGRALDLSRGAAADLGMIGAGEARVSYRIVN